MTTPIHEGTTPPYFPAYPSDFLGDDKVARMSYTEIGIYWVLLCLAWAPRGLPNNTVEIAKMLKMNHARFVRIWTGVISECWVEKNGRLVNPRQERERDRQKSFSSKQSANGKLGGRPKKESQEKPNANPDESQEKARALVLVSDSVLSPSSSSEGSLRGTPPMDTWARELVNLYPAQGRCGWNLVERPLFMALTGDGGDPWATWDLLRAALEAHKRSHQWRVKQMIPRLDKWLREGLYLQELPETPVTTLVNDRNARSLASGSEFIKGGDRGAH